MSERVIEWVSVGEGLQQQRHRRPVACAGSDRQSRQATDGGRADGRTRLQRRVVPCVTLRLQPCVTEAATVCD